MKLSKNLGRIATTFLATAMLAGLTAVPASAEAVTEPAEGEDSISSIKINAELMMPEGVLTPDVTFNFNIEPANDVEVNDTITSSGKTIALKNGLGTVDNAGKVSYASVEDNVGVASGTEGINKVTKTDVELSLDGLGAFTDAGVYKYYITEDAPTGLGTGVVAGDFEDGLKLPLYIFVERDNSDYKITGAVVYKYGETADGLEDSKTDTFVNWYQIDATDPEHPAVKTGELSIKNTVGGAMGDQSEPFDFTISNDKLVAGTTYSVKYDDGSYTTCTVSVDHKLTLPVKHGQTVTVYGLAVDSYTVTAPNMTDEGYTLQSIKVNTSDVGNTNLDQNVSVTAGQTTSVEYTFNRDAIAPTGLVMNVAPYVLLVLVAAGAGYVFLRKREED